MISNAPLIPNEIAAEEIQPSHGPAPVNPWADPVAELAFRTLREALGAVRKSLERAALFWEEDPEHVHQLRVNSRRALAAIRLFSDVIASPDVKWLRRKLKVILDAAGEARDLDILMHDQLPKCGPAAEKLGRLWRKERAAAQNPIIRLHKKMKTADRLQNHLRSLPGDLQILAAAENAINHQSCDDWARPQVLDISRQFFAAIPGEPTVRSLHDLRILTKRFRYILAFLQPVLQGSEIRAAETALSELQKQLGSLQDHVAARDQFQRSLKNLSKPRHLKTVRRLIEKEDRKIAEYVSQFRLRSDSDGHGPLRSSIDAVLVLVSVAEESHEKSGVIKTRPP